MSLYAISAPIDPARKEAIRNELNRVLSSREFRTSQRCRDFLSYVVEAVLKGHGDALKERTIGIDVFARTAEYNPSDDATVRVKAGEVRKRLTLYYSAPEGANDPIVIELPHGGYVPTFHDREDRASVPSSPSPHTLETQTGSIKQRDADESVNEGKPDISPDSRERRALKPTVAALAVAALILCGASILIYQRHSGPKVAPIFDQFWAPVFKSNESALLCVTPVPVYALQHDATPIVEPHAKDFVVVRNQFVAVGDLKAESRIADALGRAKRPVHIRVGDIPFEELRKSPAIMVGYSYSRWKEITKGLRFSIDLDRKPTYALLDNGAPTEWRIDTYPDDPNLKEDYSIITRVFDPDTGQILVEMAGISHYGTEGAAEVLTNPDLLAQAMRDAPPNWQKKNLQIVLHMKVISNTPTAPNIVATYFW